MVHRWKRRERPDPTPALPLAQGVARWAAYSIVLVTGVQMFGLLQGADAPVTPPSRHQHDVRPTQVPSRVELERPFRGHEHTTDGHRSGHDAHKRVSPRQLSLAKW
jgi:hypothetical protein